MTKRYIPAKLQELVKARAQGCCEYCICPESHATQNHSNEHIIPESLGGTTAADNLALACQGCNNRKYNKTQALDPVSGDRTALSSASRRLTRAFRLASRLHHTHRLDARRPRNAGRNRRSPFTNQATRETSVTHRREDQRLSGSPYLPRDLCTPGQPTFHLSARP